MKYKIDIEVFEGPMDLLLHLINKSKIDIEDIPINKITEQFLAYLNKMERLNLEVASDFIVMAATLIEIKSKMLLPKEIVSEEQMEIEDLDPRQDLVNRLIEYKMFKSISEVLKEREIVQSKIYYKPKEDFYFEDNDIMVEDMDITKLLETIDKIIKNKDKLEQILTIDEIQREEYTLEECIGNLKDILSVKQEILFTQLLSQYSSREEIITYFLSILELTRLGLIIVKQKDDFTDIRIINRKDKESNYG